MKNIPLERIYTKLANLDIFVSFVWLLLLTLLVVTLKLQYFSIIFPVIFANLGIVIYLVFKKRGTFLPECETDLVKRKDYNGIQIEKAITAVSTFFFFIFFSISLLSLFGEYYTKGIPYYLCISICAAILIFEIFSVKSVISRYIVLFQTFLLSLNILFANHLVFIHGISQPDFNLHFYFIREIFTTEHITLHPFGSYNIFSYHHIFVAQIALLTGYNPQSIYLFGGSFLIAIGVLLVFIIGKRFVTFQFGLVAAVVFMCLDFYLMWGEHPEHVAYNFGFALVCFTIILYTYISQKSAFYLLFVLSVVAMVLTHHMSALIVFVTICSLILIDIFHTIKKRELLFPSIYIAIFFAIFTVAIICIMIIINPQQQITSALTPYLNYINSIQNVFAPPSPVISVPVTPVPVTPVPVTPVPVTPVPVTPVPVTPPSPYLPQTAYDKIPLITLFLNTLGSSLLALVSILGFCSILKKRTWFGVFIIINAIIISFLLGFGILIRGVVFLPDRMYPFLQIFSLVFLGAFGILWLRNSIHIRNGQIVVVGICIFVGMMSFFSLASIINGFETSPFVGEGVAYEKLYTTSQDVSFGEWRNSFIHDDGRKIQPLPMNDKGMINTGELPCDQYLTFDRTLQKTGIIKSGNIFGQHSFASFDKGQLQQLNPMSYYYDNGLINLMAKNAPS